MMGMFRALYDDTYILTIHLTQQTVSLSKWTRCYESSKIVASQLAIFTGAEVL